MNSSIKPDTQPTNSIISKSQIKESLLDNTTKLNRDSSKIMIEIDKKNKSKKKKSSRCCVCNKKLGIMVFTCKCSDSKMFCITHLQPEAHQCSYDFKTEQLNSLAKKLTKVVNDKVVKI